MKIEIWSDYSCPFCYIGKTRLEKAVAQAAVGDRVQLEFKSFQLNPHAPKETSLSAAESFVKDKGVSMQEALNMFEYVTQQFQEEGIKSNMSGAIMTNTLNAHRVAKYARELGKEQALTALFMNAYFNEGQNLSDNATLIRLAESIGLDGAKVVEILNSDQYLDVVNTEINAARSMGVTGVPFFVINNKYSLSGAQPQSTFDQVIAQVLKEESPLQPLGKDSATCNDDSCDI